MKPSSFEYVAAKDIGHAIALLNEAGEDARVLAGGQSLIAMMNFRVARPTVLVDLARCHDLATVTKEGPWLKIGAMTRQRDAELNELVVRHCPMIASALSHAGPLTVRNRGTVGGSIANGYPLAHLVCVAACLEAEIVLEGPEGERIVPASEFFIAAMATSINPGEILREVRFPCAGPSTRFAFREAGNQAGGAAICMVAIQMKLSSTGSISSASVAVSGIDAVPVRLHEVERLIVAQPDANLSEAYWEDVRNAGIDAADGEEHASYAMDLGCSLMLGAIADLRQANQQGASAHE